MKMVRKLMSGEYRIYSHKVDTKTADEETLETFTSIQAAKKHEGEIQAFKHRN
jgi:hypothetical protein